MLTNKAKKRKYFPKERIRSRYLSIIVFPPLPRKAPNYKTLEITVGSVQDVVSGA